jgi:osmotically-inducible protein OsmY
MQEKQQTTMARGGARSRGARLIPAAVAALALVAGPAFAATANQELDDGDIMTAIEDDFLVDTTVPFHSVDVEVDRGVVTLSGTVDTILARQRAVELAQTIKGVRSVVDEIEVDPVPRSDDELRRDVEWALVNDPAADSYEITVSVDDGAVRLEGNVDSWQEKQLARRVAEGVRGVKEIDNQIAINVPPARPDVEMETEIRERLRWNAWVDDGLVTVMVEDGRAVLSGAVGSALERARAIGQAWVPGIEEVDASGLEVEWWARDEMRRDKYALKSDAQIRQAVKDALLFDPRVLSFNPDVKVDNGVVTLSGVVDNLEARRAAERDARNTVGVALVRNHLRVRPTSALSDEEITQRVQRAFHRDPVVDRFEVGVATFDREVSLSGAVDSWLERRHVEDVAARVPGVVEVQNNLRVRSDAGIIADRILEEQIEDELFWSPFVDSDEINVAVDNGVATLTGTVDSWADYNWAAENAREGGAVSVRNNVKVRNDQGAYWMPF